MASESVSRSAAAQRIGRSELRLLLVSFLSLYFELTLIRWIPTQVRLVAYFTNFVLIAALLGLGVGMLLAARRIRLVTYFPLLLLGLTAVVLVLERVNFVLPIVTEGQFVWEYLDNLPATGVVAYLVLIGFFLLMVAVFIVLGQEVGLALREFPPLPAYSINILGSLLGVLGFAFLNHLELSPLWWFGVGCSGFVGYLLLLPSARLLALSAGPILLVLGAIYIDDANHPAGLSIYWSPYYQIQTRPDKVGGVRVGYDIKVNKDSHQQALDLSSRLARLAFIRSRRHLYNLPYQLIHPKRILVFGAGTGNDVAAALRNTRGATIDAVEIDPVIARLGRQLHPERPYSSPRVHLHVDDARSFLQKTNKKYDLIVFGYLDSHRLFSHMSSVRMDNFVYTQENFQVVRDHLTRRGIASVTFTVHEKWIADRIFAMLNHVFGRKPLVYQSDHNALGTTFLVGRTPLHPPAGEPRISHSDFVRQIIQQSRGLNWHYRANTYGFLGSSELSTTAPILSDDWPYLYMQRHEIPANYLIVLVLTIMVSILLVWLTVPTINLRQAGNWNFFLLGAGFALQETKGITDIALLFGSTWITNIIVISAILLVILLANLVVSRWGDIPLPWVYAALFLLLISNYFVPLRGLLEYGFWIQVVASGIRVAAPLFFSGIIFARLFQRADNTSSALGANLMGAVVGGLAEYSSLALGLRQLYLMALAFYALSFVIAVGPQLRAFGLRRLTLGSVRGR